MPHSDVRLDFNMAMEEMMGEGGIRTEEVDALSAAAKEIHRAIQAMKEVGQLPFYHLPFEEEGAQKISKFAGECQAQFDNMVVLGIGGSALGPRALLSALKGPYHNQLSSEQRKGAPRIFVCDSIDPDTFGQLLDSIDPKKTLFNVISKSGETLETLAQFFVLKEMLRDRVGLRWSSHVVATTDPTKGSLRQWAREENFATLEIPSGVGGRFSVLSPVGLFPAALAGIEIGELLSGARRAENRASIPDLWVNPAYMLGALQYLMCRKKKNVLVIMPYSERLFPLSDWYVQLWAESIGKRFSLKGEVVETGSTPLSAGGPQDQHSQLQLFMEGPRDKFLLFLILERFERSLLISGSAIPSENFNFLKGKDLSDVLLAEAAATEAALQQDRRPSSKLLLPHLNAYSLGQVLFLMEAATAFAGELFEVNPFDQPGVELGKKLANGLLGKPGFEEFKGKVEAVKRKDQFVV
ncbi:MAG: glucose-6-phosphate isomerase [bacterium]